jgi:hypothetical protein
LRGTGIRGKRDERILGNAEFVTSALEAGQEQMERKSRHQAHGDDFNWLVERVGKLPEKIPEEELRKGDIPN